MHPSGTRFRLLRVGAALALVLSVAACGGSNAAGAGQPPTLTIGLNLAPVSLDPAKDGATFTIVRSLTNTALTHQNVDGTISPGLATSWHYIGAGNKDFELTLRHDATFSDGQPVTAQAVKTWLEYFAKAGGSYVSAMGPIASIEVVDEWTLRLHLATANPIIPSVLSEQYNWGFVSSPTAVANPSTLGTQTFGAGPYVLDTSGTITGQQYTLVPNKTYFDQKAIRYSKVVAKVIGNPSTMVQAIESGQIDVAVGENNTTTASSAQAAGLQVLNAPNANTGLTFAGRTTKPLDDQRVRQAMNYAVDRQAIATGLLGAFATPPTSEVTTLDGVDPTIQSYYPYDPAKAKQLLADAGYAQGFTLKVLTLGGTVHVSVAQAIAKYEAAVGITLDITTATTPSEYVEKRKSLAFPIIVNTLPTGSMWQIYQIALSPQGAQNPFGATDAQLTGLWQTGSQATDPPTYWKQMTARITDEAYFLPVFSPPYLFYVSKHVGGVKTSPTRPALPYASEWFPQ